LDHFVSISAGLVPEPALCPGADTAERSQETLYIGKQNYKLQNYKLQNYKLQNFKLLAAQTKPKNSIRSSSANRTKSNSVSHNLLSSTTNGTNGTNGANIYSRDFELIDDEDIDGNTITRNRLATSSNGSTAKRKTNGTKQTTTTNGSNYKTNEVKNKTHFLHSFKFLVIKL
jgi:hypothetical protein